MGRPPASEESYINVGRYFVMGYSRKEIAAATGLSLAVVKRRILGWMERMGTHNRPRLAVLMCQELIRLGVEFPEVERARWRWVRRNERGGEVKKPIPNSITEEELGFIADRIILGEGDEEIAERMKLSKQNVSYRKAILFNRYQARNEVQLAVFLYFSKLQMESRWKDAGIS